MVNMGTKLSHQHTVLLFFNFSLDRSFISGSPFEVFFPHIRQN